MARAYHLRPNKHIDRSLFINLLQHLQLPELEEYVYIGFGGPFLDDFRAMHKAFEFSRMISLEIDENIYNRQQLNIPCSNVELRHCTLDDFIAEHEFEMPTIIWVDYEGDEYAEQLSEAQRVLNKLAEGDVFRITLKADSESLPSFTRGKVRDDLLRDRRNAFLSKLGSYRPSYEIDHKAFHESVDLVGYLREAFQNAAYSARRGRREHFLPLLCTMYRDTTKMLTITGLITGRSKQYRELMQKWRYAESPESLIAINSPVLSAAERLAVERYLPCTGEELRSKVPFTRSLTDQELGGLVRFHQHLPHFHRTSVIT
jgi:hypothetical protein